MSEIIADFSDAPTKSRILDQVQKLSGMFRVSILKYRKRRSDAQNRMLFGLVYPYVAKGLSDACGETISVEEAHGLCKDWFLSGRSVTFTKSPVKIPGSTAKLNTEQFSEYVEKLYAFAAEKLGVVIPPPDANLKSELALQD